MRDNVVKLAKERLKQLYEYKEQLKNKTIKNLIIG